MATSATAGSTPTRARLAHLTPAEEQLYRDLCDDSLGDSVRLEQERVDYGWLVSRLRATS